MRRLLAMAAAGALGSALLIAPAHAAGAAVPIMVGFDSTVNSWTITLPPGTWFIDDEELDIQGQPGGAVQIGLSSAVGHFFLMDPVNPTVGLDCRYLDGGLTSLYCNAPTGVPAWTPRVVVDMTGATGPTTTVVIEGTPTVTLDYRGGSGDDYVQGGNAADTIAGGPGHDSLFGGLGDDKITGDDGPDHIEGEEGADSIGGGPGDDYLEGGPGADSMTGGTGVNELDSQDGIKDTYVSCDNAPGTGKISYDKGLDIPYDCPVVLPPTVPREVTADGGSTNITVSWKAPEFDGNTDLSYDLRYRVKGAKDWSTVSAAGSDTSATITGLDAGDYDVAMRATNSAGQSDWVSAPTATVGGQPSPPTKVQSLYVQKGNASVSWTAPDDVTNPQYELALRVRNKKGTAWLAWQTLADKQSTTSRDVGDDLQIVSGRVYQFRVRTVVDNVSSDWVNSPARYVGNLTKPTNASLTRVMDAVKVAFDIGGDAWTYNAKITGVQAYYTEGTLYGTVVGFVNVNGTRYQTRFPDTPTTARKCSVGVTYQLPDTTRSVMRTDVDCPSN